MNGLIDITMGELLEQAARNFPDNDAVIYTDRPYRKTYSEFNDEVNRVARGMLAIGIRKGDHVAIWATNYPEWLLTLFATAKIGAVLVTVNMNYKIFELEYLLKQSDTKYLVMTGGFKDADYIKIVNELCPTLKESAPGNLKDTNLPYLKGVIYIGAEKYPGMYNWSDLYELADNIPQEELEAIKSTLSPDDVVNMQYTSGTTGFPKGVMLTHHSIINNGKCIGDNMKFTEKDRLCIPVPFFHCFGLVLAVLACVTHASTMVPIEHYNPVMVMKAVQDEKCTALHGVPTMFIAILEHPDFKKYRFDHLRTGIMAGSPCPIRIMERVVEELGAREITIAYGLTEASPVCTQTNTEDSIDIRVSTVGKAMPYVETKIVDPETGETVPHGVNGEFCAKGYNIMKGYYKMPEATAQVIDSDGWLHTGDLASVDENGHYKITGRLKDMIIRGGENIYPKEIEEFLYTHPAIKDVQVVGAPSKEYGEEILACIILKEGYTVTEDEIKDYVKSHMARHKTPKYVWFMDSFPVTASGKIQKYKLREMAVEKFKLKDAARIETA